MAEYWSSSLSFFFLLFYGPREENFRHPLGVREMLLWEQNGQFRAGSVAPFWPLG